MLSLYSAMILWKALTTLLRNTKPSQRIELVFLDYGPLLRFSAVASPDGSSSSSEVLGKRAKLWKQWHNIQQKKQHINTSNILPPLNLYQFLQKLFKLHYTVHRYFERIFRESFWVCVSIVPGSVVSGNMDFNWALLIRVCLTSFDILIDMVKVI